MKIKKSDNIVSIEVDCSMYENMISRFKGLYKIEKEYNVLHDKYMKLLEKYTLLLSKVYGGDKK